MQDHDAFECELLHYVTKVYARNHPDEPVTNEALKRFVTSELFDGILAKHQSATTVSKRKREEVQGSFRSKSYVARQRKLNGLNQTEMEALALRFWDLPPQKTKVALFEEMVKGSKVVGVDHGILDPAWTAKGI